VTDGIATRIATLYPPRKTEGAQSFNIKQLPAQPVDSPALDFLHALHTCTSPDEFQEYKKRYNAMDGMMQIKSSAQAVNKILLDLQDFVLGVLDGAQQTLNFGATSLNLSSDKAWTAMYPLLHDNLDKDLKDLRAQFEDNIVGDCGHLFKADEEHKQEMLALVNILTSSVCRAFVLMCSSVTKCETFSTRCSL